MSRLVPIHFLDLSFTLRYILVDSTSPAFALVLVILFAAIGRSEQVGTKLRTQFTEVLFCRTDESDANSAAGNIASGKILQADWRFKKHACISQFCHSLVSF